MASGHSELLLPPKISTNGDGVLFGCELCCHTETNPHGFCSAKCFNVCPQVCKILVSVFDDPLFPLSSPPPPPPPYSTPILANRDAVFPRSVLKFGLIFLSALITCVFLLGIIWQVWKFYKSRQNDTFDSSRRRDSSPILFHTQESFRDENQGPDIDHPIWYINTVGLQQSIIDSIVVCKYKKDEGLIEGTDCSICLSEFEEDESLRLLPKCSHAFHIPCIDTWLRSHKNCPLCRAPIVSDNFAVQAQSSMEPVNSNDLDSREEAEEDNIVNNASALESEEVGGGETSGLRVGIGVGEENSPVEAKRLNYPSRVRSDLVENRQASTEGELQPVRRSVSMDSVSAMRIYSAVANVVPVPVPDNQIKKSKSKISSSKRRSGSFSVMKLMSGSSTGPILMKRSFSSSGKAASSSSTRGNRSLDSILPL